MHRQRGFRGAMEVLPEFVPLDREREGGPERLHERPYFLFVGRLEKLKGVHEILPHFRGDGPYDLLVLGTGTYEAELRRQAAGMPRVRFAGWVSQDEIHHYYRGALGVVVPSVTYETFGIVVIEALAHGVPVIANNLGALPEVVEETGGGLVYNTQDELRGHLDRLAGDAGLRAQLASRGHQSVREKYSPEAHLSLYEGLIRKAWRDKFGAGQPDEKVMVRQRAG
jgi:glycosyltransferase involved in cell wall biosynthesis